MLHRSFLALSAVILLGFAASACSDPPAATHVRAFRGAYVGIGASDASPVGYGEVHMRVTARHLLVEFATGALVQETPIAFSDMEPLSADDVAALFRGGASEARAASVVGLKLQGEVENKGLRYLFFRDATADEPVIYIDDREYPALSIPLFRVSQAEGGTLDRLLRQMDIDPDALPRVNADGGARW
ncbi:MAG: hypothetical protein RLZZ324_1046 [Candidatus Parcubacteria bacterium]|jgi:hypothetical protein